MTRPKRRLNPSPPEPTGETPFVWLWTKRAENARRPPKTDQKLPSFCWKARPDGIDSVLLEMDGKSLVEVTIDGAVWEMPVSRYVEDIKARVNTQALGFYTPYEAATLLAQAQETDDARTRRLEMCEAWLRGKLKMRSGITKVEIYPPDRSEWPTDPKKLREWEAKSGFGASGMKKDLDHSLPNLESLDVVAVTDLDEWLRPTGYSFTDALAKLATKATPGPNGRKPTSDGEEPEWQERARIRAVEIIKRQGEKDWYPSQIAIADEIARSFRDERVMGAGGKPLSGAYIKRHALKGISSADLKQLSMTIRRGK